MDPFLAQLALAAARATPPQQQQQQQLEDGSDDRQWGSGSGDAARRRAGPPSAPFRGNADNAKTRICLRWKSGGCRFGDRCNFAHGPDELRAPLRREGEGDEGGGEGLPIVANERSQSSDSSSVLSMALAGRSHSGGFYGGDSSVAEGAAAAARYLGRMSAPGVGGGGSALVGGDGGGGGSAHGQGDAIAALRGAAAAAAAAAAVAAAGGVDPSSSPSTSSQVQISNALFRANSLVEGSSIDRSSFRRSRAAANSAADRERALAAAAAAAAATGSGDAAAWAAQGYPVPGPLGWTQYLSSETGEPYYHNSVTDETIWDRPPEWDVAAAAAAAAAATGGGGQRRSPPGRRREGSNNNNKSGGGDGAKSPSPRDVRPLSFPDDAGQGGSGRAGGSEGGYRS